MNGDVLPDTNHVSRYCSPATIESGVILPAAFQIRDNESYLSVNWLEHLSTVSPELAINMVREVFRRKAYTLKRGGKFVRFNVGDVRKVIQSTTHTVIQIEHLPEENDASHAGISGYSASYMAAQQTHHDDDSPMPDYGIIEALVANKIAGLARSSVTYPGVVGSESGG